jgi:hypothetical protein
MMASPNFMPETCTESTDVQQYHWAQTAVVVAIKNCTYVNGDDGGAGGVGTVAVLVVA